MDKIIKGAGYVFLFLLVIGLYQKWQRGDFNQDKTPAPVVFLDQETYLAAEAVKVFEFVVDTPAAVKLDLAIKNDAPLDVIVANGRMTEADYLAAAYILKPMEAVGNWLSNQPTQPTNFFSSPLAREGAHQRFESPWARFEPGTYTVIVDNTPAFTPTRGDAPIRLRLLTRPLPQATP
ncbi:MAG: hypothetical protein ACLGH6_05180 [Gammaproteobacteria bacterium]